ncbi:uncharacterized protein LACBIDRAFT_314223 [Laccaria bicolor S238N-H82]|uniref:Predicted protein n=1 Tax=Laccaria bicolor (strain S238N-H82 / ATCC MYA-4686) TaxID=486041 RepID=B0D1V2_LACBS|nr:uncharacterized protein LACBIDRAFT_314223 [Laccaria bicolor S238N-H82]EDR12054.1 predicted protein [Laccaria bicolor S238N-H82]|eukprot:XP_001877951.1 predicted protein [Laccaria bicolor S238N-H82]
MSQKTLRNQSRFLLTIPWDDGRFVLENELEPLLGELGSMPFISALQETEHTLLSANRLTPRLKAVKRSLLIGEEENHSSRMFKYINVKNALQHFPSLERRGVFLDLVLQYVLIDKMVRAMNDCSLHNGYVVEVPKHRRRPIYTNKFKGWSPLHDWVKLVTQFKAKFNQTSLNTELPSETCPQSIELGLIQSLSKTISRTQVHGALANIEAAALCLRLVWKGYLRVNEEAPQSSDNEERNKIKNFIISFNDGQVDLKAINTLLNEAPTLLFGIDICTFVSPLALLTTKAWYNGGKLDRMKLFLTGKALGNQKPSLLIEVEKLLWKVLLNVAQGKIAAWNALEQFLIEVPWGRLQQANEEICGWFKPDGDGDDKVVDNMYCQDIEGAIPVGWPLVVTSAPLEPIDTNLSSSTTKTATDSASPIVEVISSKETSSQNPPIPLAEMETTDASSVNARLADVQLHETRPIDHVVTVESRDDRTPSATALITGSTIPVTPSQSQPNSNDLQHYSLAAAMGGIHFYDKNQTYAWRAMCIMPRGSMRSHISLF